MLLHINLGVTTNQKSVIKTQKRERNPDITIEQLSNDKGKKQTKKKGMQKNHKKTQKTINKMAVSTYLINDFFKCKWTKCSNQKI